MCEKKPFRSEGDALAYLVRRLPHWKAAPGRARPCSAYRCRECGKWHLTHRPKGVKRVPARLPRDGEAVLPQ